MARTRDPGLDLVWAKAAHTSGYFSRACHFDGLSLLVWDELLPCNNFPGFQEGPEAVGCCAVVLMEKQKRTVRRCAGNLLDRHCISSSASQPKLLEGRSKLKQMHLEMGTREQ